MIKNPYRKLEQVIGYHFKRRENLKQAITHPSYYFENREDVKDDNQRLEYLGDAVLSLMTADYIFKKYPNYREGEMSKLRSRLTQDRKLAQIAEAAGVGPFLLLGHGESLNGGKKRASNLADSMEAIIGAAWQDGGMKAALKIFNKLFIPEIKPLHDEEAHVRTNPKGVLQEWAQKKESTVPTYELIETTGPEHNRQYTISVNTCGKSWKANATSKREAERLAAAKALKELLKNTTKDE